jgi:hypothetical protein
VTEQGLAGGGRAVAIVRGPTNGFRRLGSGVDLGDGRILTSRHVVYESEGQVRSTEDLYVAWGTGTPGKATHVWVGDPGNADLDVAVLTVAASPLSPVQAMFMLRGGTVDAAKDWEAAGFPIISAGRTEIRLEKVGGLTRSYDPADPRQRILHLDASTSPEIWNGLSGAGIVVGGCVIGVARCVHAVGWDGRLMAVPVSLFVDLPEFRTALGLPESARAREEARAAHRERVTRELVSAAEPRTALARGVGMRRRRGSSRG